MKTNKEYISPILFHSDSSIYVYDDATRLVFPINKNDEIILNTKSIDRITPTESPRLYSLIQRYDLFNRRVSPPTEIKPEDIGMITHNAIEGGLVLHISDACNLKCRYCFFSDEYKHTMSFSKNLMSCATAKAAVDFYITSYMNAIRFNPNLNCAIAFYGGEPLINWDVILYIVDYIKTEYKFAASRIMYAITTNGILLDDQKIKFMLNNRFAISISMDGNSTEHDRNRVGVNNQATHAQVLDAVNRTNFLYKTMLLDNFSILKPGILITYDNVSNLIELDSYFTANPDLDQIVAKVSKVFDHATTYYDNQCSDDINNVYNEQVDYLFDLFEKQGGRIGSSNFLQRFISSFFVSVASSSSFAINPYRGTCLPGQGRIAVDPYGKIHVCEKISRNYSIGNIISGFDNTTQCNMLNIFVETCHNYCKSCSILNLCTLCFASTQSSDPMKFDLPTRNKCKQMKKNASWLLSKQYKLLEKNISVF